MEWTNLNYVVHSSELASELVVDTKLKPCALLVHKGVTFSLSTTVSLAKQKFDPEKSAVWTEFHSIYAMWNGVLRVVPFKIHFLIRFWSDHNEIATGNANIDAFYAGSLRIKISFFFSELFYIL